MKKIIIAVVLLVSTLVTAQESLFKNISTTDQYKEYFYVDDKDGDGIYVIKEPRFIFKFHTSYLPTGEGYKIDLIVDAGNEKGHVMESFDASQEDVYCSGFPYESMIFDKKEKVALVAIGDYAFQLYDIKEDGISYRNIFKVYIKIGAVAPGAKAGEKKKTSLKDRLKALKALKNGGASFGKEHAALQKMNLDKMVTDYLIAMKAKQDARTPAEKASDKKHMKAAREGGAKAKADEWAEAKRYNDSVKATPEYQDLERRKRQNEANYQGSKTKNKVTLRNNSSSAVYVGKSGSRNPGTKIGAGSTATWSCAYDAYIQTVSSGAYSSTNKRVYTANSGCGRTININ